MRVELDHLDSLSYEEIKNKNKGKGMMIKHLTTDRWQTKFYNNYSHKIIQFQHLLSFFFKIFKEEQKLFYTTLSYIFREVHFKVTKRQLWYRQRSNKN